MPENSWVEESDCPDFDLIHSLLSEEEETMPSTGVAEPSTAPEHQFPFQQPPLRLATQNRRRKAAIVLTIIWGSTIVLHLVSWGVWLVWGLTTLMGFHAFRVLAKRAAPLPPPLSDADLHSANLPFVTLMVAAKNEEAVIGNLVDKLCQLDYPQQHYELWVIDDNSTDRTPQLLDELAQKYPQLRVIHRPAGSAGGKSGALNQALPLTRGDIIAVFDADSQVSPDLLRRILPLFQRPQVGAVQVRKAILQAERSGDRSARNFWIQGQKAEMLVDAFIQQQRIAVGGIGELRGNGQFVRRTALEQCGGWNEDTITDDLDLTIRLHLYRWDVSILPEPPILEEGVTTVLSLWHQRNRWAEGGYQRYLDYWPDLLRNRMGTAKSFDMLLFWIIQYILPSAAIPDTLMTVLLNRFPLYSPITALSLSFFAISMFRGFRQLQPVRDSDRRWPGASIFRICLECLRGTVYMLHWFVIIGSMAVRVSVRPKRLKWVKTVHQGHSSI